LTIGDEWQQLTARLNGEGCGLGQGTSGVTEVEAEGSALKTADCKRLRIGNSYYYPSPAVILTIHVSEVPVWVPKSRRAGAVGWLPGRMLIEV